jgi:hypothetical protein
MTPAEAGLADAEIHWIELVPQPDLRTWRRMRLEASEDGWNMDLRDFSGVGAESPELFGTRRFAAAIDVSGASRATPGSGAPRILGTSGFEPSEADRHPDSPPGFRITRYADETLSGRALAFGGLPVVAEASPSHLRQKIALRSVDIVLGAYGDLAGRELSPERPGSLAEFSFLFEPVGQELLRRSIQGLPLVSLNSRGLGWADVRFADSDGVRRGDIVKIEGHYALLEGDDGDGWLGDSDQVIHAEDGRIRRGTLAEVPGRKMVVLRPRDFTRLRLELEAAGYGDLGDSWFFDVRLERACREFQLDRQMSETGIPDTAFVASLESFLQAMSSPAESEKTEEDP